MFKEINKSYNDTLCAKCNSETTRAEVFTSSWNFFTQCTSCGHKHSYHVNDQMGCEGCAPFHLVYEGVEWDEDFSIALLAKWIKDSEKDWKNENGRYYEEYDRLMFTAKNLIKKLTINGK